MKTLDQIQITENQLDALREIKRRLVEKFAIHAFILYGSISRNQADEESDVDLLVVTSNLLTRYERHQITDVVFEVNLHYETNFSTLVVDNQTWETGIFSVLPIRDEIIRDGILLQQ